MRLLFVLSMAIFLGGCLGGDSESGGATSIQEPPAVDQPEPNQPVGFAGADLFQRWEGADSKLDIHDEGFIGFVPGYSVWSNAIVYEKNDDGSFNGAFGGVVWFRTSEGDIERDWDLGSIQAKLNGNQLEVTVRIAVDEMDISLSVEEGGPNKIYPASNEYIAGTWLLSGAYQVTLSQDGLWAGSDLFGCTYVGEYFVPAEGASVYRLESRIDGCPAEGAYSGAAIIQDVNGQPHFVSMQVNEFAAVLNAPLLKTPFAIPFLERQP